MRAGRTFPFAGAHQHFAVLAAFAAMKFVNWHENSVANVVPCTKGRLSCLQPRLTSIGLTYRGRRLASDWSGGADSVGRLR